MIDTLVERARRAAGLSQAELARRAGTSRPTLSAYEHGRKSPTLATVVRLLAAAGFELEAVSRPRFAPVGAAGGRPVWVPDRLPRLPAGRALGTVEVPLHLDWSVPGRLVRLGDRRERARFYEVVLREGGPQDIAGYVDGVLLVDLWEELVLPAAVREAWAAVTRSALASS